MPRWTETWLTGLGGVEPRPGEHPGKRLGLPEDGPGSLATVGQRIGAFLVDAVGSALIGRLVDPIDPETASLADSVAPVLVLVLVNVLGLTLVGRTPGMALLGLRVATLRGVRLDPLRATLRAVLLALLVPALVTDPDRRGLHDRVAGTVVVRA